jgi:hypothetical protein
MKQQSVKDLLNIYEGFQFLENTPVFVGKLPTAIHQELLEWTEHCRKFKDHELSILLEHVNAGLNSYQISVPKHLQESSFTQAYLITLGKLYIAKTFPPLLKKSMGERLEILRHRVSFYGTQDHYDWGIWINYANTGDINPMHTHVGQLSGVLYVKNTEASPTNFNNEVQYNGKDGYVAIFPADYEHGVAEHTGDERITMSFNLRAMLQ